MRNMRTGRSAKQSRAREYNADQFLTAVLAAQTRKDVARVIAQEARKLFSPCQAWVMIFPDNNRFAPIMLESSLTWRRPVDGSDDLISWATERNWAITVESGRTTVFKVCRRPGLAWKAAPNRNSLQAHYQKSLDWMGKGYAKKNIWIIPMSFSESISEGLKNGQTVLIIAGSAAAMSEPPELNGFFQLARLAVGMAAQRKILEKRLHRTTSIAEIAQNINAVLELNILLRLIILEVAGAMRCQAADIWMLGDPADRLVRQTSLGLSEEIREQETVLPAAQIAMKTGEAVWESSMTGDQDDVYRHYDQAGIIPMAVVPLKSKNKTLGVLQLFAKKRRIFSTEERLLLKTLVSQATTAIENANLFEETKRRAQELLALHEVAQVIRDVSHLDSALEQIVQRVSEVLRVEKCWIMFWDEERNVLAAHRFAVGFYEEQIEAMVRASDLPGISTQVFKTGREMITNTAAEDKLAQEFEGQIKLRHLMAMPLRGKRETFGVFLAANKQDGTLFKGNDVRLFRTMASEATVIIQNAREYQKLRKEHQALARLVAAVNNTRHPEAKGQSDHVALLSVAMAERMGLPGDRVDHIRMAALLLGDKTGDNNRKANDWVDLLTHCGISAQVVDLVRECRISGGETASISARIIALADEFDAVAARELRRERRESYIRKAGKHFEQSLVSALESVWRQVYTEGDAD